MNNAKYYACIECDNDGYNNTKQGENCNIRTDGSKYDVKVKVINGKILGNDMTSIVYKNTTEDPYTTPNSFSPYEGYGDPDIKCNNGAIGTLLDDQKLKISDINSDTTCNIEYSLKTATIEINVNYDTSTYSGPSKINKTNEKISKTSITIQYGKSEIIGITPA